MAKSRVISRAKPKRGSSVPGTYRGFSFQTTRFLVHLLRADLGSTITLEAFDDVGVEFSDGSRLAEQAKSYTSRNPLSLRAPEWWCTLRTWVQLVIDGKIDVATTDFVICAPKSSPCDLVMSFHNSTNVKDAAVAVKNAAISVNVKSGTRGASKLNGAIKFLFSHRDIFAQIVSRFRVDIPVDSLDTELRPLLLAKLVSEDAYSHVVKWAHGWVKQEIDKQVDASKPARVQAKAFHEALLQYVRSHDRFDILQSYAGTPARHEVDVELSVREYVRQLRLIDLEHEGLLEAVNDYLRAVVDRTNWSEMGIINGVALDAFASSLTSTWRNIKRRSFLTNRERTPKEQGQLLYSECVEHQTPLDGYNPPSHFVKGSFHALSDEHVIGWHPDYKTLLHKAVNEAESSNE